MSFLFEQKACTSSAKKGRGPHLDQEANLMSPVRNLSLLSPNPAPRSTHHSHFSAVQAAKQNAAPSILLSDDIMVGLDPPACSLLFLPALLEAHAHVKSLQNSERCFAMMVFPSRRS